MSHKIDQIFRKHLEHHKVQPSADAWERLYSSVRKGKEQKIKKWYAIAASLLLIGICSFVFFQYTQISKTPEVMTMKELEKSSLPDKPAPEESLAVVIEEEESIVPKKEIPAKKTITTVQEVKKKETIKMPEKKMIEIPEKIENLQATITTEFSISKKMEKPTFIEFNHDEGKKNTLFDRITNTALEIKNSDGVMAELRQLKDEVVSLEFFKTKKSI